MSTVHELKCWPRYFERLLSGEKTFELRQTADRDFQVGDTLRQREFDPTAEEGGAYTGRELSQDVTFVLPGGQMGVSRGWCCMAVTPPYDTVAGVALTPAATWEAFAKGKCRVCGDFRRVDAANVCLPCATDGAADDRGEGQAHG